MVPWAKQGEGTGVLTQMCDISLTVPPVKLRHLKALPRRLTGHQFMENKVCFGLTFLPVFGSLFQRCQRIMVYKCHVREMQVKGHKGSVSICLFRNYFPLNLQLKITPTSKNKSKHGEQMQDLQRQYGSRLVQMKLLTTQITTFTVVCYSRFALQIANMT